ncbi:hypothetical protein K493DRAFT_339312 [Basidiobolus meristosporus CBS 931.73]|uniref:TPR-like protein n=1 Tax=Basidiobolus meristosporus CBS 931.73 TaxID=1314790 RepID=A0A1Y1Y1F3_9FUNG|nr:hypothetical protein K493DRAFT_339312 [Basidiobolus meristosporus CBS 931.73]|eukprot:ORX91546.1 hypothetical protein K493DRAFT_339312 [Basidiobolus meristosporus CBS 931.73]
MTGEQEKKQVKRPRGLKKAALANKKAKVEEPEVETNEEDMTLVMEGDVDEVEELRLIYESAGEKLAEDQDKGKLLLNGTVHEADRLLRNWGEEPIPSKLYLTYGSALFDLSELQDKPEDATEYLNVAIDRLDSALEKAKEENTENNWELNFVVGKAYLTKARITRETSKEDDSELIEKALKHLDAVFDSIPEEAEDAETSRKLNALNVAAELVRLHTEVYEDWEQKEKLYKWAEAKFAALLKVNEKSFQTLVSLGGCYLSMANSRLEKLDENQEGEDEDEEIPCDDLAKEYLENAVKYLKDAESRIDGGGVEVSRLLTLLGEAQINLGNMEENEEAQYALYQQAVDNLKKATTVGGEDFTLPEQFGDFLDEWENELQDDKA